MTLQAYADAYSQEGSVLGAAKFLGITFHQSRKRYHEAVAAGIIRAGTPGRKTREEAKSTKPPEPRLPEGRVRAPQRKIYDIPPAGKVNRFLCFSAQNDTYIHEQVWHNLVALKRHFAADPRAHRTELVGARFTYMKGGLGASGDKARFTKASYSGKGESLTWPAEIQDHIVDESVELAPGLVWCGEMNILPTEVSPLTGLDNYTGVKSAIIPHVKFAMRAIPTNKFEKAKHIYTTGTVTMRNYILRKAGLKAAYHHCYGALLVEVCDDGTWFARQINADSDGTMYDLDVRVHDEKVETGVPVEAIVWGDLHAEQADDRCVRLAFGEGGVLDTLKPSKQFLHDVLDFPGPNHHNTSRGSHAMFIEWINGNCDVRENVRIASQITSMIERDWCDTYTVVSNHHDFLRRWCSEKNGLYDPKNAEFWLDMNHRLLARYRAQDTTFSTLEEAFKAVGHAHLRLTHLREDESFIVCPDAGGGIECGMHGHLGPRGSRGGPGNLSKVGLKACVGHYHEAGIYDGLYTTGTNAKPTPHWMHGPGGWSPSDILIYANGKRAIMTKDPATDRWRA